MSAYTHRATLWNKNHSHPEYPTGMHHGMLRIDYDGIAFKPEARRLPKLAIHYDNLFSTFTEVTSPVHPMSDTMFLDALLLATTVATLGIIQPRSSHLSLKFKLVELDKICVIGFVVPVFSFFGGDWAERAETIIWEYKRDRTEARRGY